MNKTSTPKKTIAQSLSKISSQSTLNEQEPSENTVMAILRYSQALSVRKSKNIDFVDLILN